MLGDNIRIYREASGLTQSDLAKKVGIKKQTLFKYEHNIVTNVPLEKVEQIAAALDVDPAALTGWSRSQDERLQAYFSKLSKLDDVDRARIAERIDTMLEDRKYEN